LGNQTAAQLQSERHPPNVTAGAGKNFASGSADPRKTKAEPLSNRWFQDEAAKEEVSEILKRFDLDESAIEAEAIKLASEQLEWLDKALVSAGSRLDKALRFVKSYRAGFIDEVRRHSDRLLIDDATSRRSAA
jgi:hypothetical protein